jgi:hypothetical protein
MSVGAMKPPVVFLVYLFGLLFINRGLGTPEAAKKKLSLLYDTTNHTSKDSS